MRQARSDRIRLPAEAPSNAGLGREEVAQRANVSATWYTWLEQGRGGTPSADVLDRIALAMMLTDVEREHFFLLGLGRPPEVRYQAPEGITPRLQRVLDTLEFSPAFIRTATWDVVAWNRAAAVVLTDYGTLPGGQRNGVALDVSRFARSSCATQLARRCPVCRRVQARRAACNRLSMSCARQVPNSRRCGATTMCKGTAMA